MIDIILFGARGRMGKIITAEFAGFEDDKQEPDGLKIAAGIEREGHPDIGKTVDNVEIYSDRQTFPKADVWVDFSLAAPAVNHVEQACRNSVPIVIAATGFTGGQLKRISESSEQIPILLASNLSVGIGVMDRLLGEASYILGKEFDPVIVECHHSTKKDAPSGTALRLADTVRKSSGESPQVCAIRAGGVIGEHQARFVGKYEELIITHRAWSRQAFSRGVKRAVKFLMKKSPGLYTIKDMYSIDRYDV